jgi:hypothetical protein
MLLVRDVAHVRRVSGIERDSLNYRRFLLNLERFGCRLDNPDVVRATRDPQAISALISSSQAHLAGIQPLEVQTGNLDDARQLVDYKDPELHAELLTVFELQEEWTPQEHRAYWTSERLLRHTRPRGGSKANREALAYGYVLAWVDGVPENAIPLILGKAPKSVREHIRPVASQMLQELGDEPLPGAQVVDVSALPWLYPRVALDGAPRRYLPFLDSPASGSFQTQTSVDTILVGILPRLNAWLREHPDARRRPSGLGYANRCARGDARSARQLS